MAKSIIATCECVNCSKEFEKEVMLPNLCGKECAKEKMGKMFTPMAESMKRNQKTL